MAGGINKVILIGNLGVDPEVRYLPSGSAVANLRIATSESWRDKTTGEPQERTEWHRVSLFGKLAEIAGQYLHKGSKVYIEGKLRTRKWQGQDGQDRYTTEIIVDINGAMQMLDSRGSGGGSGANAGGDYNRSASPPASAGPASAAPMGQDGGSPSSGPDSSGADFDDDIPF